MNMGSVRTKNLALAGLSSLIGGSVLGGIELLAEAISFGVKSAASELLTVQGIAAALEEEVIPLASVIALLLICAIAIFFVSRRKGPAKR